MNIIEDLPCYDYYIPSEFYINAFEDSSSNTPIPKEFNTIDILLPNGLVVCIQQESNQTLAELRQILRKRYAVTWPFNFLSIAHTSIHETGDLLLDEQQSFDTLGLVYPFLRVSAKGELPTPLCKWLSKNDQSDVESLTQFIEQLVEWRDTTIPHEILHAPPSISQTILSNIDSFFVYIERLDKSYCCKDDTTCEELIGLIRNDDKKSTMEYYNASTELMLKFSYRNEFLLKSEPYPLLQYTYIQECLQKNIQINLQIIYIELPRKSKKMMQIINNEPDIFPTKIKPIKPIDLMKENELNTQLLPLQPSSLLFKFTLRLRPSVNAKQALFQLHSGIYYGRRCLFSFEQMTWDNTFTEEKTRTTTLPIANLLPGTLLCFALTNKQSESYFLNVSLFRSTARLLNGSYEFTLNAVNSRQNIANMKHLYPDGFIGSSCDESTPNNYEIKLRFDFQSLRFYDNDEISKKLVDIAMPTPTAVATAKQQQHHESSADMANGEALNYLLGSLNDETQYMVREPSWLSDCSSAPIDALPCVLHSILADIHRMILSDTNNTANTTIIYEKFFSMYKLINLWPPMSFEMCFFLLDCTLPDAHIRSYAVSQLVRLPNHLFLFYLPQIIQAAIQFEHYIDTPLIRLVLKRALCHRAIGQKLFWTLLNVNTRNGRVMFELYKTYCGLTIANDLQNQFVLTLKLNKINQRIRAKNIKDASAMQQALVAHLRESDKTSWRCVSPLDTGCFLGSLLTDECKVYDSFMRPFKLVWENALNPTNERFELIYKIGDDLRQDVLTLQVFRLFDSIWKKNSILYPNEDLSQLHNVHMTFYDVMCTSDTTGFIRIVPNACTILNIYHRFNTTTTIKRNVIYDWLVTENNTSQKIPLGKTARRTNTTGATNEPMDSSVPNSVLVKFRKSCAAYCTAGFVMGLGDRHPSNIMLTSDGRLFHVDFGHILGDYVKFGNIFPRETTSIVLVEPFLYVINNRKQNDTPDYREFIQICLLTFRLLRENATSLFGLLYLIIYARLPLLNSISNLNYLRQSLFLIGEKPCETKHAIQAYKRKIESAQNDTRRFLDWIAHAFLHKPQR
ncbi:unnamed protein product [Rotaria magnacalcarata]|uniref:Phosphoinositide 3-kinase n=1 Tax=Rotaria magnacalcarata TaxID=392030 RepID=A0A816VVW0_9BILA|nr:unnamed protein product [Rotaria magnacalcarata]CAF2147470.1 unnamed protein product [Rotaria magnacalcarata]CAF3925937.1 unnamed protein product [Rotaria magnacalcarata]CAF4024351.1 unnamed protein product [Rotaria magnacalcarata]